MLSSRRLMAMVMAVSITLVSGCTLFSNNNVKPNPAPERRSTQQNQNMNQTPNRVNYSKQGGPVPVRDRRDVRRVENDVTRTTRTYQTTVSRVRRTCVANENVDRAAAVIVPGTRTALCGVDLENTVQGSQARKVLSEVKTDVQALPEVSRCYVSADPQIFTRIRTIANETANGKPISAFSKEISQIMSRIVPK